MQHVSRHIANTMLPAVHSVRVLVACEYSGTVRDAFADPPTTKLQVTVRPTSITPDQRQSLLTGLAQSLKQVAAVTGGGTDRAARHVAEAKKAEQKSSMFTQFPTVVRECLFAGSNASYFDADALQWMRNQIIPFETQIEYGDIVVQGELTDLENRTARFDARRPEVSPYQMIERPMEGRRYILFADCCVGKQAIGSDDAKRDTHSYGVIRDEYIDPVTRERFLPQIVAMCRDDDRCITPEFIRRVVRLSIYYGDCLVAPEINGKDDIATRMIAAGVKNMYVQGLVGADGAMPGTKKTTEVFGWLTTEGTRRQILDNMQEMTLQQRWICTFGIVLQQMSVFIINKKGRAEAAPSEHDDHCIGPSIGLFNLPHATKYVGREQRVQITYQQDWNAIYHDPTGL